MSASKHIVRPYGDTTGDGMVQMSFTLPLPLDKRAEGAAFTFVGPSCKRAMSWKWPFDRGHRIRSGVEATRRIISLISRDRPKHVRSCTTKSSSNRPKHRPWRWMS